MKKLFLILLGFIFLIQGCNDSDGKTETKYVQVYEMKFRNDHFPDMNYALTTDTYISSSNSTDNYGLGSSLQITEFSTNLRRTLINFRIGGYLPSEAVVIRALLTFYAVSVSPESAGDSVPVHIYPVYKSWSETQASWVNISMANPWNTSGGDYNESDLMDTVYLTEEDEHSYIDFELDPDFVGDKIKDHYANGGFLLKLSDGDQSVVDFDSSEATGFEPLLTVYYY